MQHPPRRKQLIVIAGSEMQFQKWKRDNNLPPNFAIRITDPEQLRGRLPENSILVLVGQYNFSPVIRSKILSERFPEWRKAEVDPVVQVTNHQFKGNP